LNLLNEEIPQIYCLCGRGSRSSLRILRHGIASTELGTTATNLSTVTGIYTIKRSVRGRRFSQSVSQEREREREKEKVRK
jgi:hypothetical protein